MPTAQTYWSDTITHAATGVTYHFAAPVEYGHYWNGDIFVVSGGNDVTITRITPEWSGSGRIMHGATLAPPSDSSVVNAFDDASPQYNAAGNHDPAATGSNLVIAAAAHPTGASLVKAVSYEDPAERPDHSYISKYAILTVVPSAPPADAFRPPVLGNDKTSHYTLDDLDFTKLQNVTPVAGQAPITADRPFFEGAQISWFDDRGIVRDLHPGSYHGGYNDYELDGDVMSALMALHSDHTNAEKRDLYAAVVQHGIDFAGFNNEAGQWLSETTHQTLYPPIIAVAAVALDSQDMRDALLVPRGQTDFFYVTQDMVGVENFSFTSSKTPSFSVYTDGEVGNPDWRVQDNDPDPSLTSAYRLINTDTVPAIALLMDMLGDGEGRTVISDPAYFDYAERTRLVMEIEPGMGETNRAHIQSDLEAAFLTAYHATYTNHSGMTFKPERPYDVTVTATGPTALSVSIDGEVFPGSSPVTRVDVRYKAGDGAWTEIQDFGMSGDITGLTAGQVYFVQARFVSALGEGPWGLNEFNERNRSIDDILLSEGVITQAELDAQFGGSTTQYRKSSLYEDHLRSIVDGDAGLEELTDDLVTGTAIPPQSGPAPIPDPAPAPGPQPDPIGYPAPADRLDFDSLPIEDFQPGNQDKGDHGVSDDGATLTLDSQAWQAVVMDVEVTADTTLGFDFSSQVEGEIHGVMFANGDTLAEDTAFNVFGTQGWGIEDYAYNGAGAVQRIDIPVGAHFTGNFDRVVFFTDDDAGVGAESTFANVLISTGAAPEPAPEPDPVPEPEPTPEPADSLDFDSLPIENFQPGTQDRGEHAVSPDGTMLTLDSQAWQSVLTDVEVTADTRLSFDFSAAVEGEIHGVMFANGDTLAEDTAFNVVGTQGWGIQDYAYDGEGAVQRIDIPVGAHFTGNFDRVVFFTDDDAGVGAESTFANVVLSTGDAPEPAPAQALTPISDPAPDPVDEAQAMGVVQRVAELDHEARTVEFHDAMELTDAIVFVTPPTFEGTQAASVALEEVTATGATMAIHEPGYLDGWHMEEDLAMLALEAGSWSLADGSRLEVGSLTLDAGRTERFASVTFDEAFDEAPAILVQLQSSNGADWAVLRTRDVTTTGFEVALQEQEASDGLHEAEIVGWAALDAAAADGVVDWSGVAAQFFAAERLVDHAGGAMAFDAALGPDALIAAGISSFHGPDTATLRLTETWAEGDQTIAEFLVQEEQSRDSETEHVLEDIAGIGFAKEGVLSAQPTAADLDLVDAMSAYMDIG